MITTTLNRIREHSPCQDGWEKLLNGLGKTKPDDKPLPFATILEIVGLDDALWYCRAEPKYAKEWRLFAVAVARRVEHLNTDPRVKNAIDAAERYAHGNATDAELNAAWETARETAREAAWAARAARAAWAATWDAAWSARAAVWEASGAAEREWQTQEFLRLVNETEAREDGE
jgi:hypothetical protein